MSEKVADERTQGTPSQRALGVMESAVRRARERAGMATMSGHIAQDTQPVSVTRPPTAPTPPVSPLWTQRSGPPGRRDASGRREHWLIIAIAAVAVLVVVAGVALGVSAGNGGPQRTTPPPSTVATGHARTPPTRDPATSGRKGGAPGSRTTTSTAPPATPGGPPVISSISPASGTPGESLQIAGSNFLSSDGQIVATFNGQVAPTSCPASNTCTVTVPPMSGSRSARVTITTAGGTSNAVTFTYS